MDIANTRTLLLIDLRKQMSYKREFNSSLKILRQKEYGHLLK